MEKGLTHSDINIAAPFREGKALDWWHNHRRLRLTSIYALFGLGVLAALRILWELARFIDGEPGGPNILVLLAGALAVMIFMSLLFLAVFYENTESISESDWAVYGSDSMSE